MRREPSPEIESALSRVRIFSDLKPSDLKKLASACLPRNYSAGEVMIEEGSTGLGLFVITAGRVEVFKTHEGRKIPLAVLGSEVLGEMALLDDQPRSASAVALEHTECLLLSRERFRTLLKRWPRIAWPIVQPLARRVRDLQEQLLEAKNRPPGAPRRVDAIGTETPPPADEHVSAPDSESDEAGGVCCSAGECCSAGNGSLVDGSLADNNGSADDNGSGTDILRAPYALIMTGAVGFGESARLFEVFFRSLDDTSGLSGGRPMGEVLRDFPQSLATAGLSSWDQGRRLPSKLLGTFRDNLRSNWRGEEPD